MAARATVKPRPLKELLTLSLPLEEQIRRRAHEIYLARGGSEGSDLDDWLQAEIEIQQAKEDEAAT
jgi:hypothetical protein